VRSAVGFGSEFTVQIPAPDVTSQAAQ
jgi:hypothetical protein